LKHLHYDGIQGYRSRFDDIHLVYEFLEEVPPELGLRPAMPPFILPYYNGVVPEDAGISSFLFLAGGHITLHTFPFREEFFFDLVSADPYDEEEVASALQDAFPCRHVKFGVLDRTQNSPSERPHQPASDFGPHLFLDIEEYDGPDDMDRLFDLFDRLPSAVGMTPIMRPYLVRNQTASHGPVLSAMTMIAESHITLHAYPERDEAYLDLFSCRPFDEERIKREIRSLLPGHIAREAVVARGADFRRLYPRRDETLAFSRSWLAAVPGPEGDGR